MAKWATLLLAFSAPLFALGKRSFHEIQVDNELRRLDNLFTTADDYHIQTGDALPPYIPPPLLNGTVNLPINHFGPSPSPYTFKNRFWVVDEYYKPGGPVFTLDTGESDDGYAYKGYLLKNTSFINKYLRDFNGLGILWEHRYYGQSTPYPVNLDTTSEQFQWLTTDQALEDFAVFARGFKWRIGGPDAKVQGKTSLVGKVVDFNPKKTPWVHVGGSYPGMRAAMLRNKYPDVIYACK